MSLSPGTRLGPYEIQSLMGAGGMGEVYRARDPRLGRVVAIKVLPGTADGSQLRRFEHEARAVAALSHPNILAIFDVGIGATPYLVTELLDGETLRARMLRGRLPLPTILDTARQFLSGLAAAHARGIVHRDLKPDNIFLTRDGVVKILDFGLAKNVVPTPATLSDVDVTSAPATIDGAILGTVGYMAPEQVRGAAVDHRSDIFAVGTVLYEMVTGDRAFRGESPADTMSAILREQPRDVPPAAGVPPALGRIIQRCLEKAPDQRFQSAQDLRFAVEGISQTDAVAPSHRASSEESAASIAVLPFTDMSAQRDQAYFCEGMAEEIINALAKVDGLRVAARTSTFQARAMTADLGQIAAALGVRHLLEGSVRTAGQRLRVTAQVVDVRDQRAVWSDRFDGAMADVFEIQDTIAERIVSAFRTRLVGATAVAPARRQYTPNVEAYQAYLQGLHHRYTTYNLLEALRWFERATELDPGYADAHVGVAYASAVLSNFAFLPPLEARSRAPPSRRPWGSMPTSRWRTPRWDGGRRCTNGTGRAPRTFSSTRCRSIPRVLKHTPSMGCSAAPSSAWMTSWRAWQRLSSSIRCRPGHTGSAHLGTTPLVAMRRRSARVRGPSNSAPSRCSVSGARAWHFERCGDSPNRLRRSSTRWS